MINETAIIGLHAEDLNCMTD